MKKELEEKKPNVFILGAPKCGTTAVSEYLKTHPDIFLSEPKEPGYFSTDIFEKPMYRSDEDYVEQCFGNSSNEKIKMEASTSSLYSKEAVPNILKFNPDAKFIVMVRNPVEAAYSLHSQLLKSGNENTKDFETAWRLQEKRRLGYKLPKTNQAPLLQYGAVYKFGEQIKKIHHNVDDSRVLIIELSTVKNNSKKVYKDVLDFMQLQHGHRENFPVINSNRSIKNIYIHKLIHGIIGRSQRKIKDLLGVRQGFGFLNNLSKLNQSEVKRKPLPANFKKELNSYFYEDSKKFERITGIKLL